MATVYRLPLFMRFRGNVEWNPRYNSGITPRKVWRATYALARAHRNTHAFAIMRANGTLWDVL